MATIDQPLGGPPTGVSAETPAAQARLARGALSLFGTLSSTLANLAPVEGIFLSLTLVVVAMGSQALAIAAAGTAIAYFRRPDAIRLAGSIGPEFLREDG